MSQILITSVKEQMIRDLNKLKQEISAYQNEDLIWKLEGQILNTAGNLCLHLSGNIQHFIGAVLGKSDYVRDRDAEFSTKGVSRENLLKEVDKTLVSLEQTLTSLSPTTVEESYPVDVFGKPMTTGYFLIHLAGHLNYHLGQVNYHRRLISE